MFHLPTYARIKSIVSLVGKYDEKQESLREVNYYPDEDKMQEWSMK